VLAAVDLAEIDGALPTPWAEGERGIVIRIGTEIVEGRRLGVVEDGTDIPPQSGPKTLGTHTSHTAG
jgi:hypothetical protein